MTLLIYNLLYIFAKVYLLKEIKNGVFIMHNFNNRIDRIRGREIGINGLMYSLQIIGNFQFSPATRPDFCLHFTLFLRDFLQILLHTPPTPPQLESLSRPLNGIIFLIVCNYFYFDTKIIYSRVLASARYIVEMLLKYSLCPVLRIMPS
jgi:hypothetical protein